MENTNELDNLYWLARSARDSGDDEKAFEYYRTIAEKDGNSWEALLYMVYSTMKVCPHDELKNAVGNFIDYAITILNKIKEHVEGKENQICAVKEATKYVLSISDTYFEHGKREKSKLLTYSLASYITVLFWGDGIEEIFGEYEELHETAVDSWKDGILKIRIEQSLIADLVTEADANEEELIQKYTDKIQRYDSSYQTPSTSEFINQNTTSDVSDSSINGENTDELDNLYQLARNARDSGDDKKADDYYLKIAKRAPHDWEAFFYVVYYTMKACPPDEVEDVFETFSNEYVIDIIGKLKGVKEKEKQILAVNEATQCILSISNMFFERGEAAQKPSSCYSAASFNSLLWGDSIESVFGDYEELHKAIVNSWKDGIEKLRMTQSRIGKLAGEEIIQKYTAKIQKYDSSYQPPQPPSIPSTSNQAAKSGGCYVATSVYGSYDCPPVWTLRRYRDNVLAETWYGRLFIRIYYAVSPTLVKLFGNTSWFKKLCKGGLDRLVSELQEKGVENTPYKDQEW